jgi:glycerate kinase
MAQVKDPLRVLIVPDKFKGTLTAQQAATAIADGWTQIRPADRLELLPMADGGDGFGTILGHLLKAQRQTALTVDAAGRPRLAEWWFEPNHRIAVIEAAEVNGLAWLSKEPLHPFQLDTFGLGAILRDAKAKGARLVYVGIGGSATNDAGFGMARSLGWRFFDKLGVELRQWSALDQLETVIAPEAQLQFDELIVAVDVQNPLLGSKGATRVYGPQKGLKRPELEHAEACLSRLAEVLERDKIEKNALAPGAGAAGGLGFGLTTFCGGTLRSGGLIFASIAQLMERVAAADLVITAEGQFDAQTLSGKGVAVVAATAAQQGKPCLCFAGSSHYDEPQLPWSNFRVIPIVPHFASPQESLEHAEPTLRKLAAHVATNLGVLLEHCPPS